MCDMTPSYVWHDSFICVTWLIHMCDMTPSYVWQDALIYVTWLMHTCDMTQSCMWHDSFIHVTWHSHHSLSRSLFLYHTWVHATWLIDIGDMTHASLSLVLTHTWASTRLLPTQVRLGHVFSRLRERWRWHHLYHWDTSSPDESSLRRRVLRHVFSRLVFSQSYLSREKTCASLSLPEPTQVRLRVGRRRVEAPTWASTRLLPTK